MAYAGTPTGLAQQAGASRPWKTALAAIAVLAIGLALVIAVMFVNSRVVAPATGRDDGQIEAQRDATLSAGATSNAVEKAAAAKARAMSGVPGVVNLTSTAVEKAAAARARAMSGVPAVGGTSAAGTEGAAAAKARATQLNGNRLDATSVDRKYHVLQYRGAHGPR